MKNIEPDLSIIIVNHNGWHLLAPCLDGIQRTADDLRCEVWVVDNGSSDGSVDKLQTLYPMINCIANPENVGFAKANNQAIRRCRGRYVLLLNNDTVVLDDALQKLSDVMEANPSLAVVGPQLLNRDGSIQPSCMRVPTVWRGFANYLHHWRGGSAKYVPQSDSQVTVVDAVSGACFLMRAETLAQVGLLDEDYFMYAEESDWCFRARKLGWQVGYVPTARVIHVGGQTAEKQRGRFYVERRISRIRFKLKHFGHMQARLDAGLIRASVKLRWLMHPSQRDYYEAIDADLRERLKELFSEFRYRLGGSAVSKGENVEEVR